MHKWQQPTRQQEVSMYYHLVLQQIYVVNTVQKIQAFHINFQFLPTYYFFVFAKYIVVMIKVSIHSWKKPNNEGSNAIKGKNVTNLVKYFSSLDEYEVIGIYNKRPKFSCNNLKWKKADLTNSKDVHRVLKGMDIIVQAAATTSGSKDIVSKPGGSLFRLNCKLLVLHMWKSASTYCWNRIPI